MKEISLLIKPASGKCNLRCEYCFYEDEKARRKLPDCGMMTMDTVETMLRRANEEAEERISFAFQGGEPMVAGLGFFKAFTELEQSLRRPGICVEYAIQTNGTLINEEWAAFFREHNFLVGVSLDGTKELHDSFRKDPKGTGSFKTVLKGLRILQKHGVDVNILTVVTGPLARRPQAVYEGLKKLGVKYLQFIPCLAPLSEETEKHPFTLPPERYGQFLCILFDQWYRDWERGEYTSIRLFDDYVHLLSGQRAGTCATAGTCGGYFTVEADGSVYPCDFYALDEFALGNIREDSFAVLTERACAFCARGRGMPSACKGCEYAFPCNGGCQREWNGTETNQNCAAYKALFDHAMPRLKYIAELEKKLSSRAMR